VLLTNILGKNINLDFSLKCSYFKKKEISFSFNVLIFIIRKVTKR